MPKDETIRWQRPQEGTASAASHERPRLPAEAQGTTRITPGAENRPVTPFVPAPPAPPQSMPPYVPAFAPPPVPPAYVAPAVRPDAQHPAMPQAEQSVPPKPEELARVPDVPDKHGGHIGAWRPPGSSSGNETKARTASANAAVGSAFAFSNAAAGAGGRGDEKNVLREHAVVRHPRREAIDLIGFDATMVSRMRKVAAWKKIMAEVNPKSKNLDEDDEGRDKHKDARDRREVLAILSNGPSSTVEDLNGLVFQAMADLAPMPLGLASGEIEFPFDEMETLKATLAVVAPFVPGDKKLKETVDVVREVMATPGIERARTVVQNLNVRVRDAFGAVGRGVSATHIESQTEPMLLEGRCFQKRTAMGKEWIRAAVFVTANDTKVAVPGYVALDLVNELPMLRRFSARMVVEARPRVEQSDAAEIALKVVALGRRVGRG